MFNDDFPSSGKISLKSDGLESRPYILVRHFESLSRDGCIGPLHRSNATSQNRFSFLKFEKIQTSSICLAVFIQLYCTSLCIIFFKEASL